MDYSSIINDFVDGRLDSTQEDNLFYMLSKDDELRNELKQSMRIEKAFGLDAASMSPSASSTIGVFSKLGIALPTAVPIAEVAATSKIAHFFGRYSQAFVSGFVSTLVTAVAVFLLMNSSDNISNDTNNFAGNGFANPFYNNTLISDSTNKVPYMRSMDNTSPASEPKVIVKYKYIEKIKYIEKSSDFAQVNSNVTKPNADETNNITYNTLENANVNTNSTSNDLSINNNRDNYNNNPLYVGPVEFLNLNEIQKLGIYCEFKSSEYWSFPKPAVNQSTNPDFANTSITLLTPLTNSLYVGMDFRQEFFYQKYEGYEGDKPFEYLQHTNFFSGGIVGRYYFDDLLGFNPFTQVSLGGNKAGLIGRFMLGVNYSPMEYISLMLGVEGSVLRFHHQGNYYYAPKIGLNYGLSFNF